MEDRKLTKQLKELGDKLDIPLLDHVVIGDNRYVSFKEQAWFERDNPI
jgi:DNA repair protein RadC